MSWVLDAIEKEADARASARLVSGLVPFTFHGLNTDDLKKLIGFYEALTGRKAADIGENMAIDTEIIRKLGR